MGDQMIEILHTGVGEKVCRERIEKFLKDQQFDLLISAGFAGALNDQAANRRSPPRKEFFDN